MSEPVTEKSLIKKLQKLIARLPADVSRIEMEYAGSGDDGSFENAIAVDTEKKTVSVDEKLMNELENAMSDAVELKFSGWENGDGASGTVSVEVADGTLDISHDEYYTESNNTVETILF